jgi:hypothetical protein
MFQCLYYKRVVRHLGDIIGGHELKKVENRWDIDYKDTL